MKEMGKLLVCYLTFSSTNDKVNKILSESYPKENLIENENEKEKELIDESNSSYKSKFTNIIRIRGFR